MVNEYPAFEVYDMVVAIKHGRANVYQIISVIYGGEGADDVVEVVPIGLNYGNDSSGHKLTSMHVPMSLISPSQVFRNIQSIKRAEAP